MVTVSKKILWVSIGLVLVFSTVAIILSYQLDYSKEPLTAEEKYPITENMSMDLKHVYESCQCQENLKLKPGENDGCFAYAATYNNETHNINNTTCKWGTSSGVNLEIQPRKSLDIIPLDDGSQYNAAVTGDTAETICRFLDIPCPTDPKFRAKYDFEKENGRFSHYINDEHYSFKITNGDTILVYSTYVNGWVTLNEYNHYETDYEDDFEIDYTEDFTENMINLN